MTPTYPCNTPIYLYLHHLPLNHLALLRDPHANRLSKRLRQRLRLRHLQRVDFRRGQHRERHVRAERLRHPHRNCGLARARRARDQHRPTSDFSLLDHLQDDRGGLARPLLPNQALRASLWFECVGLDAETADVRVGGDEGEAAQFFRFGDGADLLDGLVRIEVDSISWMVYKQVRSMDTCTDVRNKPVT